MTERTLLDDEVDDVDDALKIEFATRFSPVSFSNVVRFQRLTPAQKAQLGDNEGSIYTCYAANLRRLEAAYPIIAAAGLRLLSLAGLAGLPDFSQGDKGDKGDQNAVTVQKAVLTQLGFGVEAESLSFSKLMRVKWSEQFFQALATAFSVTVIVYIEKSRNYKYSHFAFFYPSEEAANDASQSRLPLMFVLTLTTFSVVYRTSYKEDLNTDLTSEELRAFNDMSGVVVSDFPGKAGKVALFLEENSIWLKTSGTGTARSIDLSKYYAPRGYSEDDVYRTGFEYKTTGAEINSAPQAIAAGLVLTPGSKYTNRAEFNFVDVRFKTSAARRGGEPSGIFDTFTALDIANAATIYDVNIVVQHIGRHHNPLYAVFFPSLEEVPYVRITLYLTYDRGVFTLVMPAMIDKAALQAYNAVFSEDEKRSPKYKATLGNTQLLSGLYLNNPTYMFPRVIPMFGAPSSEKTKQLSPVTSVAPALRPAQQKKGRSPVCSSSILPKHCPAAASSSLSDDPVSGASSFKGMSDDEALGVDTEDLALLDADAMPLVDIGIYNQNIQDYKFASDGRFGIPLLENFSLVDEGVRAFNDNTHFKGRFMLGRGVVWPRAYIGKKAPQLVFVHNIIPGNENRVPFPTHAIDVTEPVFFDKIYTRLCEGSPASYTAYAVIDQLKPFGSLPGNVSSPELDSALLNIDGFMRVFEMIGGFVERFGILFHRYNLFHLYALMVRDIAESRLDQRVMTERFLWFLYSFLLVDNMHLDTSNTGLNSGMVNESISVFADRLFTVLFTAPCFKWEFKLAHTWLFAYVTLNPKRCVLPTGHLRANLLVYLKKGVFDNPRVPNTSVSLMSTFQDQLLQLYSVDDYQSIPDAALEALVSWERLPASGAMPKLPIYDLDYRLLFSSTAPKEFNAPSLELESLYFHTQVHSVIQTVSPPADPNNADAFLYSLQTFLGLPLCQYAIEGHPLSSDDPAVSKYIHGAALQGETVYHTAVLRDDLTDASKRELLNWRVKRVIEHGAKVSKNPNLSREPALSEAFTISDTKFLVKNPDGTLRFTGEGPRDVAWWKVQFEEWSLMSRRYHSTTVNVRDPSVARMWDDLLVEVSELIDALGPAVGVTAPRGGDIRIPLAKAEIKFKALDTFFKSVGEWNIRTLETYPTPNAFAPLEAIRLDTSAVVRARANVVGTEETQRAVLALLDDIAALKASEAPIPPLFPLTFVKKPISSVTHVQPPFPRILRSSVGLCVVGIELAKRAQKSHARAFETLKANLWNLVRGLDRAVVLLMASPFFQSSRWAFPLCKNNAEPRRPQNETSFNAVRRDETFLSDAERQIVFKCEFLPDVIAHDPFKLPPKRALIVKHADSSYTLSQVPTTPVASMPTGSDKTVIAELHEKVIGATLVMRSPLREGVPIELVQNLVERTNKILRVATNVTVIQNYSPSPEMFRFYTPNYIYLADQSVYNGAEVPAPLTRFVTALLDNSLSPSAKMSFTLTCSCLEAQKGPATAMLTLPYRAGSGRVLDSIFPSNTITSTRYYLEYEIDKCFVALRTTDDPSVFYLHAPLALRYKGIREVWYSSATKSIAYLVTFAVSIADETLRAMSAGFEALDVAGYFYNGTSVPQTLVSPSNRAMLLSERVSIKRVTVARHFHFSSRSLGYVVTKGALYDRPYVPGVLAFHSDNRYATLRHIEDAQMLRGFKEFRLAGSPWSPGMPGDLIDRRPIEDRTEHRYTLEESAVFSNTFLNMENLLGWPRIASYKKERVQLISNVPLAYVSSPLRDTDLSHPFKRQKQKRPATKRSKRSSPSTSPLAATSPSSSSSSSLQARKNLYDELDDEDSQGVEKIQRVGASRKQADDGESEVAEEIEEVTEFHVTPFVAFNTVKVMSAEQRAAYLRSILKYNKGFLPALLNYLFERVSDIESINSQKNRLVRYEESIKRLNNYYSTFPEAIWAMEDEYATNRIFGTDASSIDMGGLYKRKEVGALFTALSVVSDSMKKEQKDWMGIDVPKPVTTVLRKLKKKKKRGVSSLDDDVELKKLVREEEDAKDDAVWLQDYASDALYVFNHVDRLGTLNDERRERFTTILVALLSKELNDYSFLYRKLGIVCVFLSENLYLLLTRVLVKIAERSVRQNVFDKVFMPWNEQLYTVVFLPMFKVLETKHRVNFLVEEASRRVMNALNTQLLLDVCKFKCGTSGVASRFSSGALRAGAFVFPRFAWATASNEKLVDNIASELRTFFNTFSVTAFEDDPLADTLMSDSLLTTALVRDVMAKNNRKRLLPTASSDLEGAVEFMPFTQEESFFKLYRYKPAIGRVSARAGRVAAFRKIMRQYEKAVKHLQSRSVALTGRLRLAGKSLAPAYFDAELLLSVAKVGNPNDAIRDITTIYKVRFNLEDYLVDHLLVDTSATGINAAALMEHRREYARINALINSPDVTPKETRKIVWEVTNRLTISLFFDRFKDEIPEELQEQFASVTAAFGGGDTSSGDTGLSDDAPVDRIAVYREALAVLQYREFVENYRFFGLPEDEGDVILYGAKRRTNELLDDSDLPPELSNTPQESGASSSEGGPSSFRGRTKEERIDDWLSYYKQLTIDAGFVSKYALSVPQNVTNEPAVPVKYQLLVYKFALAMWLLYPDRATPVPLGLSGTNTRITDANEVLEFDMNLESGFYSKITTAIFLRDDVVLAQIEKNLDVFLKDKLVAERSATAVIVRFSNVDRSVSFSPQSLRTASAKATAFNRAYSHEQSSNYVDLDDRALVNALWGLDAIRALPATTKIEVSVPSTSGGDTHLGAIIAAVIAGLPNDPRDFLQQLMAQVLMLNWPLNIGVSVLKQRGAISRRLVIANDTVRASQEEDAFAKFSFDSRKHAREILGNELFSRWEEPLAVICWDRSALFSSMRDVEALYRFVRTKEPNQAWFDSVGVASRGDTASRGGVKVLDVLAELRKKALKKFRSISVATIVSAASGGDTYSFTPFEREAAALLLKNATDATRAKVVYGIKKHEWERILTQPEMVSVFKRMQDPAYRHELQFRPDHVKALEALQALLLNRTGTTLTASEVAIVQAAQLFGLNAEGVETIIEGCVLAGRWTVLQQLVMARINMHKNGAPYTEIASTWAVAFPAPQPIIPEFSDTAMPDIPGAPPPSSASPTATLLDDVDDSLLTTPEILASYLESSARFQTILARNKGNPNALRASYAASLFEFEQSGRLEAIQMQLADRELLGASAGTGANPDTLYIAVDYLVFGVDPKDRWKSTKAEMLAWIADPGNQQTQVMETSELTFAAIMEDRTVEQLGEWSNFIMLLVAAHKYERPIRIVTNQVDSAFWQSKFVAADAHLGDENRVLSILCIDMNYFIPLTPLGQTLRSLPFEIDN